MGRLEILCTRFRHTPFRSTTGRLVPVPLSWSCGHSRDTFSRGCVTTAIAKVFEHLSLIFHFARRRSVFYNFTVVEFLFYILVVEGFLFYSCRTKEF